jgi:hypothetical protein
VAASAALAVAGGGLVWANFYASAGQWSDQNNFQSAGAQVTTIDCPDVGQRLADVPDRARAGVDRELALLDQQVTEAYKRLTETRDVQARDPGFAQNAIFGPLKSKRAAAIDRININIRRVGGQETQGLDQLAECKGVAAQQDQGQGDGQDQDQGQGDGQDQGQGDGQDQGQGGQDQGQGGQADDSPVAADYQDITTVQPSGGPRGVNGNGLPANGDTGSTGSFTSNCGTNENKNRNSDNIIAAPGVANGAQHKHDYVGNQANNAFASDEDLANGNTSCANQDDKSSYYWPVLRVRDGQNEIDADAPGGGKDGNVGRIVQVREAQIRFVGNKKSNVVAMPRALRIITGDAKSFVNGLGNANTNWSCTGFEDRQLTDKYPICPQGSSVVRTSNFQSCWDGRNTDSANHRTHVDFVEADGSCANGFQAIPQLQVRLVYDVQAPRIQNGQVQNAFAVDGFPDQLHKPITDHNDFLNFFGENTMKRMVDCINNGQDCE